MVEAGNLGLLRHLDNSPQLYLSWWVGHIFCNFIVCKINCCFKQDGRERKKDRYRERERDREIEIEREREREREREKKKRVFSGFLL